MYEDTKFKIIDMKPERDLIHYVWTRFITLAGKVNLEGELYMSKNIPYTIETLAIEFNRGAYQVKLALDVFVELEMIELTAENVYIVKNFVKHQNIKVKETIKSKDKGEDVKIKEVEMEENLKGEIYDNGHKQSENKISEMYDNEDEDAKKKINEIYHNHDEEYKSKISANKAEIIGNDEMGNLETTNKDINKIENIDISRIDKRDIRKNKCRDKSEITNRDTRKNKSRDIRKIGDKDSNNTSNNICDEKNNNNLQDNMPILLEVKNRNKVDNKKNTINCNDIYEDDKMLEFCDVNEENGENEMFEFFEGDEGRPLMEGECVVEGWSF